MSYLSYAFSCSSWQGFISLNMCEIGFFRTLHLYKHEMFIVTTDGKKEIYFFQQGQPSAHENNTLWFVFIGLM